MKALETYAPTESSQSLHEDAGAPTVESAGPALPAEVTKITPWSYRGGGRRV